MHVEYFDEKQSIFFRRVSVKYIDNFEKLRGRSQSCLSFKRSRETIHGGRLHRYSLCSLYFKHTHGRRTVTFTRRTVHSTRIENAQSIRSFSTVPLMIISINTFRTLLSKRSDGIRVVCPPVTISLGILCTSKAGRVGNSGFSKRYFNDSFSKTFPIRPPSSSAGRSNTYPDILSTKGRSSSNRRTWLHETRFRKYRRRRHR